MRGPYFYALLATGCISRIVASVGLGMVGDRVVSSTAETELARYPVWGLRLASSSCCGQARDLVPQPERSSQDNYCRARRSVCTSNAAIRGRVQAAANGQSHRIGAHSSVLGSQRAPGNPDFHLRFRWGALPQQRESEFLHVAMAVAVTSSCFRRGAGVVAQYIRESVAKNISNGGVV